MKGSGLLISTDFISKLKFDASGLIPAVAQDFETGEVLMLAYMNEESIGATLKSGHATYYSRSRRELWEKGATSGHFQNVREILVDCDCDALVLKVEQTGAACHTNHYSCFYRRAAENGLEEFAPVVEEARDEQV